MTSDNLSTDDLTQYKLDQAINGLKVIRDHLKLSLKHGTQVDTLTLAETAKQYLFLAGEFSE